MRIAVSLSVNAVGGQGGRSVLSRTLEGHETRPKAATRTAGGLPETPVPTRTLFSLSWVKTAIISMGLSSVSAVLISSTSFCPHQLV